MSEIHETLLLCAHMGQYAGHRAGIIMAGHCLPIACSHSSWAGHGAPVAESGIYALWESTGDVEDFFECLGIHAVGVGSHTRPSGLWVYQVAYLDPTADEVDEADEDGEAWVWLTRGRLRRPTVDEVRPLALGQAPWGGVVL